MRTRAVQTILNLAKQDPNVLLITGDLGFGVLKPYWEAVPKQFLNAGIAEQDMTGMAAGLALEGKTVFTYSIGNFPTLRCLEQIRNDCAYHDANVKIICVGGGFTYGSLGMSHHATEDLSIMRALPGVTVFAPSDADEAEWAIQAMYHTPGTCYVRLGRGGDEQIGTMDMSLRVGCARAVREGSRVALLSSGGIYSEISEAERLLKQKGICPAIYTFPTVKPMDAQAITRLAASYELLVTVEENTAIGGFGGAVAEIISTLPRHGRLLRIGLEDTYSCIVGTQKYLRDYYGMSAAKIAQRVEEALK